MITDNVFNYTINDDIKLEIINQLYYIIDLNLYRYKLLESNDVLNTLIKNEYYVSINNKNDNYFLFFINIDEKDYSVLINRKKLSYTRNNIELNNIEIINLDIMFPKCLYNKTLLDGKFLNNNKFVISDAYYLMGIDLLKLDLEQKINYLNGIIKIHFSISATLVFDIIKIYKYHDIKKIISIIKTDQKSSSIIFYPKYTGINIIFVNKYKKDNTQITIQKNKFTSDNILLNYEEYLTNQNYSYYNGPIKRFWLKKSHIPDVYNISLIKNGIKDNIALIPNYKISRFCDINTNYKDSFEFECVFCSKYNKWIPINKI